MDASSSGSEFWIARRGRGFAAWGPRFYIWEEDARELLRAAGDLAEAAAPRGREPGPPARLPRLPRGA